MSRRLEFLSGMRAELPLLIAVFPFGLIYGVLALQAEMPLETAQAMSWIVFAGSAQLIATQLIGNQVPGMIIVFTIVVINLRHLLYSASMAPHLEPLSQKWKWLLSYLLTDEAYAVTISHYETDSEKTDDHEKSLNISTVMIGNHHQKHWYFLGAGLTLWVTWQISTAAGIYLGAVIPETWSLDFVLALTFIALLIPFLNDAASLIAAGSAGLFALLAFTLPNKLGLLVAAMVGIIIGMFVEMKE